MLGRKGKTLQNVVGVLREYHDNITEEPPTEPVKSEDAMAIDDEVGVSVGPSQRGILEGLISFLESC